MAQQGIQQYFQQLTDRVRTECFDRCAAAALGRGPAANRACSCADPGQRLRRCITSPSQALSSREQSCLGNCVDRYLGAPLPAPAPRPLSVQLPRACCQLPAASCLLQPELTPAGCAQRR